MGETKRKKRVTSGLDCASSVLTYSGCCWRTEVDGPEHPSVRTAFSLEVSLVLHTKNYCFLPLSFAAHGLGKFSPPPRSSNLHTQWEQMFKPRVNKIEDFLHIF